MGQFGKYYYCHDGYEIKIREEHQEGCSHVIATVANLPDKLEIAKNMVAALNSRDRYIKQKNNT